MVDGHTEGRDPDRLFLALGVTTWDSLRSILIKLVWSSSHTSCSCCCFPLTFVEQKGGENKK